MKDLTVTFNPNLGGLDRDAWYDAVESLAEDHGYFEPLGTGHAAAFIDAGRKLLVTFESYARISKSGPAQEAVGFSFVRANGWSHLCLLSEDESAFREERIYRYFDRLVDDGFFEDFDSVLFYGEHLGGYAAAAYSVAAPGARVLACRPLATLDPTVTLWDSRHTDMRRLCFTDRYGFAPDMIEAVETCYLVVDPTERLDAMHAALFHRPNTVRLPVRRFGAALTQWLRIMGIFDEIVTAAMDGSLTAQSFGALFRARRDFPHYLRRLAARVESSGNDARTARLCRAILARQEIPQIATMLARIEERIDPA